MNCIICYNDITNRYVNYTCECGYEHNLHTRCCSKWIKKKQGNYCLICNREILKEVNIINKNKKRNFMNCF